MSKVPGWVQGICDYPHLEVGKTYKHPKSGRELRVTGGRYWGEYGLSNFWDWEYLDNGEKGCGYGWAPTPQEKGL